MRVFGTHDIVKSKIRKQQRLNLVKFEFFSKPMVLCVNNLFKTLSASFNMY